MNPRRRTAFVAGATGYTGREVVRLLVERGIRTIAHVRPDSARLDEWRLHFERMGATVDVTPWTDEAMAATMERLNPDIVFALLGTTRARRRALSRSGAHPAAAARRESYEAVDYGLTAMLIRATEAARPDARFVYLSSIGVRRSSRSPYLRARAQAERELERSFLDYIIARPSFITGPDRDESRPAERVTATVMDAALEVVARLGGWGVRRRWHSRTATALASALVRRALDPGPARRTWESQDL